MLSTQIPDVAGETLTFPTVQTCEVGETAWVEVAAAGAEEPEHPAPAFEVTAAAAEGGHSDTAAAAVATSADAAPTSTAEVAATATTTESSSTNWVSIAALVAGLLGLGAGGVALARTRRT